MNPVILAVGEGLLFALDLYRRHANKPPEWLPTAADWAALQADVESQTAEKFKADARAALDASRN